MNDNTTPIFFKSSHSGGNGDCVEVALNVAREGGPIIVRDSKNPDGGQLTFTPSEWKAFLAGAADGEFNL